MLVLTSGSIVVDRTAADLPDEPRSGKVQYTKRPIEEHVGGFPANVAIDLVKLGIAPEEVGVVAAVGKDSAGDFIESALGQYGVQRFLQRVDTPTGQDLILVPKGKDRSFNIAPGANLRFNRSYLKGILEQEKPKMFSMRPGYSGIDDCLTYFLKDIKDTFIFLDLMKPFEKMPSFVLPAFKFTTVIHCNYTEAMDVTGCVTISQAREELVRRGASFIFMTGGEEGAELITPSLNLKQPSFSVEAIDPTGCGDAFCAGIIKKIIEWDAFKSLDHLSEERLKEMLIYAQAVGAACATEIGATAGVSIENVENILKKTGNNY